MANSTSASARPILQWLPRAREEIFTREKDGLVWTKVKISGSLKEPKNDLAPRLAEALKKDPAAAGLLLRGTGEWIEQKIKGAGKDEKKTGPVRRRMGKRGVFRSRDRYPLVSNGAKFRHMKPFCSSSTMPFPEKWRKRTSMKAIKTHSQQSTLFE